MRLSYEIGRYHCGVVVIGGEGRLHLALREEAVSVGPVRRHESRHVPIGEVQKDFGKCWSHLKNLSLVKDDMINKIIVQRRLGSYNSSKQGLPN